MENKKKNTTKTSVKNVEKKEVKKKKTTKKVVVEDIKVEVKEPVVEIKEVKENKKSNKNKVRNIIIIGAIVIVFLLTGLFTSSVFKKDTTKGGSAIDKNSPTYQGKNITEKDGNTIIQEENNSWTIETKREQSDFINATDDIRKGYKISNVSVTTTSTATIVKGKIENKKGKYSKLYVNVKFYSGNEVIGSSSVLVENLKKGKSADFEIKTLGNYKDLEYKVEVEYVG